jgi:hypothetical protein
MNVAVFFETAVEIIRVIVIAAKHHKMIVVARQF